MSDEEFLAKMDLIKNGKLTNAAMVLLGSPDYARMLEVPARVMWRLYGSNDMVKDYKEYNVPFITVVDRAYENIRNLTFRYLPNVKTLFPTVTQQYDIDLLKELMNNCIAHMDYTIGGRIYLDEFEDNIVLSNPGSFIPKDVRYVLKPGYRVPYYRNQLLSDAMRGLNMIDTVQMGILRIYNIQRDRYFPLPDYDVASTAEVSVKVYGKLLDENYTRLLFSNTDLDLDTVFLLDHVQKKNPLTKEQYKELRGLGLIQGNLANISITIQVNMNGNKQDEKAGNMVNNNNKCYIDMMLEYLAYNGSATKADFVNLLADQFPDSLNDKQQETKVRSLIRVLQKNESIERTSDNKRTGAWRLAQKQDD
jgi:ATP-dependent DNA helicase RecG